MGAQEFSEGHAPSGAGKDAVMPIAIIGISGRFPGDAENPEKLWSMVSEGRSALADVPADRFNIDAYYHPHPERHGTINARKAHFMNRDISAFDAPFFTMPIAEVQAMDPQQRMTLECAYEAMENAGLKMEDMNGSNTSCFVGSFTRDYSDMLGRDPEDMPLYLCTGTGAAMMSNRISWFFNLKGSSISIDTACSSSLAALHLGCQSLRSGETNTSIVGGVNLMLMPDIMGAMSSIHFLSPDGKCQSFNHKANGYSRGEGSAFCVLKPLELAIQDGDTIRGVIRNTAVNQDGNTPGITLPLGDAQETLIRDIYSQAGLKLADTTYVEAHGTGTPAGDPVEAGALGKTFGAARPKDSPLIIGSIKSNIGHLEGASGLAQVVKSIFMLEKGEIPPTIWYEKPNPRIPMKQWNLKVPTELVPWPTQGLRRISINSFGYGGTNAHCIIDDAYHYLNSRNLQGKHNVKIPGTTSGAYTPDSGVDLISPPTNVVNIVSTDSYFPSEDTIQVASSPKLVLWSSSEQAGIARTAESYATYLADHVETDMTKREDQALLQKLAWTLGTRRSIMPWRSFAIADTCKDAIDHLQNPAVKPIRGSNAKSPPRLGFVFTGQGAQWYAMGRELFCQPIFRESLESASSYYASLGASWSLVSEMFLEKETSRLGNPELSQAICTALQVALVDLFESWGIRPDAVVGHSSGEIAAAYAKGALHREDAWKIAYHRGRLSSTISLLSSNGQGAMLATSLGEEAVQPYLERLETGKVTLACINSPSSTTISGDSEAISSLETAIKADGHFARKLLVNVAYHSPQMEVIAGDYQAALGHIQTLPQGDSSIHMFSSLTGKRIVDNIALGADDWASNIVNPVRFSDALSSLLQFTEKTSGRRTRKVLVDHLIEIGPHAALKGPVTQVLASGILSKNVEVNYHTALERGKNASETALTVAGKLFQFGYPIKIPVILQDRGGKDDFLVDLPPYAWNHTGKYWSEPHSGKAHRFRKHIRTDLCGGETTDQIPHEPRWKNILRLSEVPWMSQHKVQGSNLYPAAGMVVAAIEAISMKADPTRSIAAYELRDVIISKAIVVPETEEGVETMLSMRPFRQGSQSLFAAWQEFQLHSRQEAWEVNCSGLIRIEYEQTTRSVFADEKVLAAESYAAQYEEVRQNCYRTQHPGYFYNHLDSIGLHYGGVFQGLSEIRKGEYQSACKVKIPDTKSIMPYQFEFPHVIHPATLDCLIQMALPVSCQADEELAVPMVPASIGRIHVSAKVSSKPGDILTGFATSKATGFDEGESRVIVSDETWTQPLVIFEAIKGKKLNTVGSGSSSDIALRKISNVFHWQEDLTLLTKPQMRELCAIAQGSRGHVERQVLIDLEMACAVIIKRVLTECSQEEAEKFTWHFKLFYEYMKHCFGLAEAGQLPYQKETSAIDWLSLSQQDEQDLLDRVSQSCSDGRALVEHGKHLPQILRGEIPPLQILMADNFLHDFYKSGLGTEQHYHQMSWYIDQEAHKNPNMKILEIGAGTAGATLPVLTKLGGENGTAPRFAHYQFTDISVGYFEKARTKLAPWLPFLSFATLNIEEDPINQGFEEGAYDLIVASNVLHATKSISKTLEHTRKLLKPNGKLVLTEVTPFGKMRFHLIVGSLDGWWYGEDDGRKLGPTLEVPQWHDALLQAGFDGVDVDFQDFSEPIDTCLSVIVSNATAPRTALVAEPDVVIVLPETADSDITSAASKLSDTFRSRGSDVLTTTLESTLDIDLTKASCICLSDASTTTSSLPSVSETSWSALKQLILTAKSTIYLTRGGTGTSTNPSSNLMTGMARSIRSENFGVSLTTLDADSAVPLDNEDVLAAILKIFDAARTAQPQDHPDYEYAIRAGRPMIQRALMEKDMNDMAAAWYAPPKPETGTFLQPNRPLALGVGTPGRLDTLRFEDDKAMDTPLGPEEVEITVRAAGLNFKDIMVAMGQLSQPALGVDCAGVVHRVGSRVEGIVPGQAVMTWKLGTFANLTRAPAAMVQPVPEGMDLAAAAALPVVYTTAHYSLSTVARLRLGESVLIHGAAGGVGQAAIVLAQNIGAEIFCTVSSEAKRGLLVEKYGIPEENIFNSRDEDDFSLAVQRLTGGEGVDVVLNSLSGEALRRSWRCIKRFGRFVELGQKDIVGNTGLDMEPFLRNVSYHSVNMLDLLHYDLAGAAKAFAEVVELLRRDIAKPIAPTTVMPFSKMEEAFRMMQTGKHMGKIVLEAIDEDLVPMLPRAVKTTRLREDATYLIAGGGGGLGRAIAAWMVKQGAKNILLLSRSGSKKASARDLMARLSVNGAKVDAWSCDVSDEQHLISVMDKLKAEGWPAVKGIVQGAMQLQDATYENMTHSQFNAAIRPKVHGSWNLHAHLPEDMDFFVLLSSLVGIAGSRGQGNYAAGNTYQDALAHYRRSKGLAACCIDVGMILGVGFLAEDSTDDRVHDNVRGWSFLGIGEREFLNILDAAIRGESLPGVPLPPQLITGLGTGGMMARAAEAPWWFEDVKFSHLITFDTHTILQNEGVEGVAISGLLAQTTGLEDAADIVCDALVKKLAKSLMVSVEDIEKSNPVSTYGVDSLLAVELRSWMRTEIKADVSVFDLLSNIPITALATKIATSSKAVSEEIRATEQK